MNIFAGSGRLTRDPELRYTQSNVPVASFTMAIDRPGVKGKTDFIDCIAWEKKALFVNEWFKKGMRIEVSGVLTTRTYEKDGQKRKVTEIKCDQVFFGESKKEAQANGYSYSAKSDSAEEESDFHEIPNDDEVPF